MPKTTEYHPQHDRRRFDVTVSLSWTESADSYGKPPNDYKPDQTVLVHAWLLNICEAVNNFNNLPNTHDSQLIDLVALHSDHQRSRTHIGEAEPF